MARRRQMAIFVGNRECVDVLIKKKYFFERGYCQNGIHNLIYEESLIVFFFPLFLCEAFIATLTFSGEVFVFVFFVS